MFSTSTCVHCKPVKELLENIENIDVVYRVVDTDPESMSLAQIWEISSVPTMLFIKNEEVLARHIGGISKEQLDDIIRTIQPDLFSEQPGTGDKTGDIILFNASQ